MRGTCTDAILTIRRLLGGNLRGKDVRRVLVLQCRYVSLSRRIEIRGRGLGVDVVVRLRLRILIVGIRLCVRVTLLALVMEP